MDGTIRETPRPGNQATQTRSKYPDVESSVSILEKPISRVLPEAHGAYSACSNECELRGKHISTR